MIFLDQQQPGPALGLSAVNGCWGKTWPGSPGCHHIGVGLLMMGLPFSHPCSCRQPAPYRSIPVSDRGGLWWVTEVRFSCCEQTPRLRKTRRGLAFRFTGSVQHHQGGERGSMAVSGRHGARGAESFISCSKGKQERAGFQAARIRVLKPCSW